MMPRQFRLMYCTPLLAVLAGCGSSKPIQEEPNAPSGNSSSMPGPQTGEPLTEPVDGMESAPSADPTTPSEPTEVAPD